MPAIPRQTRIYAALLTTIGCVVAALCVVHNGLSWTSSELALAFIIFAMIAAVERFQVDIPNRSFHFSISVGSVLSLGAAFALPPILSALVVVLSALLIDGLARLRPIQVVVNVVNLGLATLVAAMTYEFVSGHARTPLDDFRAVAATIIASIVYTILNLGALSIIVAPVVGETPVGMWKTNFSGTFVIVTLPMLGSLVPITAADHSWGILILVVPLAGAHMALRALKKVQLETQATIVSLTDALEFRDAYTHHHSARVTEYVTAILDEMPHLPSRLRLTTIDAARIHDVGKVGIRDVALLKDGKLTDAEFKEIQRHPVIGADIVQNLEMYRHGASVVRHHHERWDGRGYPDGLKGEDIPLGARIIAVGDSYDAMTSNRPYRRALSHTVAMDEIARNSGIQFDPQVVEAFQRAMAGGFREPDVPASSSAFPLAKRSAVAMQRSEPVRTPAVAAMSHVRKKFFSGNESARTAQAIHRCGQRDRIVDLVNRTQ